MNCLLLVALLTLVSGHQARPTNAYVRIRQTSEKESRTPAQQKIDSQLLYAIYQVRGEAKMKGVPREPIMLRKDKKGRVLVDIRSVIGPRLLSLVKKSGGRVLSKSQKDHSLIAFLPLVELERIARLKEVEFISQPSEAITH